MKAEINTIFDELKVTAENEVEEIVLNLLQHFLKRKNKSERNIILSPSEWKYDNSTSIQENNMVKCPYCGRLLNRKMPHKCNGNFRKNFHNKKWLNEPSRKAAPKK